MDTPDSTADTMPEAAAASITTDAGVDNKAVAANLQSQMALSKRVRTQNMQTWKTNVDARLGRPDASLYTGGLDLSASGANQSTINPDWSLTKTKTANLYSQVPAVQMTHEREAYKPAIYPFAKAVNYELGDKRANVGVAMEEVLNDVVNAAGIGAILVRYVARYDNVKAPVEDSIQTPSGPLSTKDLTAEQLQRLEAAGLVHLTDTPRVVSDLFEVSRRSPADLLTPKNFTGSNFDNADWVGHSDRMTWADAVNEFKLREAQKSSVLGSDTAPNNTLRVNDESDSSAAAEVVSYDELFYWRHRVDPEEKSLKAIWRLVFVHGITEPVVHEQWTGQVFDAPGKFVGCSKFPLRFLTLTYITDNPIPPSDTQAGRPQVLDMRRSRNQMFQNRDRSIPIRWFDVNRIAPELQDNLMHGVVQGMIPTNGDGSRSVGEIARASYPSEDLAFDRQTKADLMEAWQIGENQQGTTSSGAHTAEEAGIVQQNFATRIGQERGRVASFFLSVVEVLAGLMALYSDFPSLSDEERQAMQQAWDSKAILHDLVFKIRPDATILLDTTQQIQRLTQFLNITVKSGYVNPKPIIEQIAELSGIDPALVMVDPQDAPPDEPNISYRFTGKDDMMNPMVVAMLIHSKQAPTPDELKAAFKMLQAAQAPEPEPAVPAGPPGSTAPAPGAPPPPGAPGAPAGGHDAHPDWQLGSKVAQRSEDM